jgi:hypothetical protein
MKPERWQDPLPGGGGANPLFLFWGLLFGALVLRWVAG